MLPTMTGTETMTEIETATGIETETVTAGFTETAMIAGTMTAIMIVTADMTVTDDAGMAIGGSTRKWMLALSLRAKGGTCSWRSAFLFLRNDLQMKQRLKRAAFSAAPFS